MWDIIVRCPGGHMQKVVDPLPDVDGNFVVKVPGACLYCPEPKERELTRREKRAVKKAIEKLERL